MDHASGVMSCVRLLLKAFLVLIASPCNGRGVVCLSSGNKPPGLRTIRHATYLVSPEWSSYPYNARTDPVGGRKKDAEALDEGKDFSGFCMPPIVEKRSIEDQGDAGESLDVVKSPNGSVEAGKVNRVQYSRACGQSPKQSHSVNKAEVQVSLDDIIEEAFKRQVETHNLCAMSCKGKAKDELVYRLLSRFSEYKRKRKNLPHLLYVCRAVSDVSAVIDRYTDSLVTLGKFNIISGNQITITPNSLLTIADSRTLFRIYNVINENGLEDANATIKKLGITHGKQDDRASGNELTGETKSCFPSQELSNMDLRLGKVEVSEGNSEEFVQLLGQLLQSYMQSHGDLLDKEWTNDTDLFPPKEALLSLKSWVERSYHSPEQLANRLMVDEAGKRLVLLDGFVYDSYYAANGSTTSFFDEIMISLKKECQVLALSPKIFSSQNISQWLKKLRVPMEFVVTQALPEFRVAYGSMCFDPFDTERKIKYSSRYNTSIKDILSGKDVDITNFFNVEANTPSFCSNVPWNVKFKEYLKDVIKDALRLQGIDTLHKFKHASRRVYNYIKKYFYGPSRAENQKKIIGDGSMALNAESRGNSVKASTIDDVLENLINMETYNIGATLIHKAIRSKTFHDMMLSHAQNVVDRVIDDAIFPTVVYNVSKGLSDSFDSLLNGKFDASDDIKDLLRREGLESDAPHMLQEGVAVITRHTNPDIVRFVKDNISLFRVIVTDEQVPGARHIVWCRPVVLNEWNEMKRNMNNIQQANIWLGAERVTFYGVYPLDVARSLISMMNHAAVDFSGYNAKRELGDKGQLISECALKNGELNMKMQQMTFAKYMLDCRDNYIRTATCQGLNEPIATSQKRDVEIKPHSGSNGMQEHHTVVKAPIIKTMLDRHEYLETLESKLLEMQVDMQPFYILDQKVARAKGFDDYITSHINTMISLKSMYIKEMGMAASLCGADVVGCDGKKYKVVWIGDKCSEKFPMSNVSDNTKVEMQEFMHNHSRIGAFSLLKGDECFLLVPLYFIKDIESIPQQCSPMDVHVSRCTHAAVSIIVNEGMPVDSVPKLMPYLILTNGEPPEQVMLPQEMEAFCFLPRGPVELCKISQEMWNHYGDREAELMDDATSKLLNSTHFKVGTKEDVRRLINQVRSVYRNRSLGGLEVHSKRNRGIDRSWGHGINGTACSPHQ